MAMSEACGTTALELSQDAVGTDGRNERFSHLSPCLPFLGLRGGLNSIPMEQTASSCSFISWKQNPIFQEPQPPCHQLNITVDRTLKIAVGLPNTRRHATHRATPLPLDPRLLTWNPWK